MSDFLTLFAIALLGLIAMAFVMIVQTLGRISRSLDEISQALRLRGARDL